MDYHQKKTEKGSLTQRDGYWVVIAKDVSEQQPSFAFVKAVYNYYHSNLKNVRENVLELLENKDKDSVTIWNIIIAHLDHNCTAW